MPHKEESSHLQVGESKQRDIGKKRARISPDAMDFLHVAPGDVVEIVGKKTSSAIVWPVDEDEKNPDIINIDGQMRKNVGMSTIHGAESFYEFLRPEHKEKKAWVCNGSACMCAGNQDKLKEKLVSKLGKDKVGEMFCLGHCYDNTSFHYNGHNYSGKDIDQIDEIIKGKKINTKNINSVSHATKSILMDKDLSTIEQFKDLLSQILKKDKKETLQTITESNQIGRASCRERV